MRKVYQWISKFLLERYDIEVCWGHSAGWYTRPTRHWWVENSFYGHHCTSCGITSHKETIREPNYR